MLKMRELGINLVPATGEGGAKAYPLYMTWSNCDGCATTGDEKKDKPGKPKKNTAALNGIQLERQLDGYLASTR